MSQVKGLEGRTDARVLSNASSALALLQALEDGAGGLVTAAAQPVVIQRAAPRANRGAAPNQPSSAPAGSTAGRAASDEDKDEDDSMRLLKTAGDRNKRVRDFLRTGRPAEAPRSADLLHEVGGVDDAVVSQVSKKNNSMRQFLMSCRQDRGHDSGSLVSLRRKAAAQENTLKNVDLASCTAGVRSASPHSAVQRVAHELDFSSSERIENKENVADKAEVVLVEHASLLSPDGREEAPRPSEEYFNDNSAQDPLPLLRYYAGDIPPQASTKVDGSVLIARDTAKKLSRSAPKPNRAAGLKNKTENFTGGSGEDLLPIFALNKADASAHPNPQYGAKAEINLPSMIPAAILDVLLREDQAIR